MPRRLAYCITDLDAGGAERALVQIACRLQGPDWQIKVFCLGPEAELAEPLQLCGIEVESLDVSRRRPIQAIRELAAGLRQWQPELLQTFLFHANIAGRLAARSAKVPLVVSGLRVAERDARWRMRLDRWTQSLVTCNVCVSRGVADFSITEVGLAREKTVVIPNGVDAERFSTALPADLQTYGIPPQSRTLLFVGRLHPQKAPELLIEAARPLIERDSDLYLLLVGDGPMMEELRQQVRGSGMDRQVLFPGRLPNVAPLLKASTLLVLPSRWEGMPNVVLEAMAAGCPVVATAVEGSSDLIRHGESGWLCNPNSVNDLRAALTLALADESTRRRVAEESQRVSSEEFTWSRVAESYAALYARLIEDRPRS
ncbi:MAG: glycosyltransferase [Planctomycetaceae bacterium]